MVYGVLAGTKAIGGVSKVKTASFDFVLSLSV
jgi:hypothetical protein